MQWVQEKNKTLARRRTGETLVLAKWAGEEGPSRPWSARPPLEPLGSSATQFPCQWIWPAEVKSRGLLWCQGGAEPQCDEALSTSPSHHEVTSRAKPSLNTALISIQRKFRKFSSEADGKSDVYHTPGNYTAPGSVLGTVHTSSHFILPKSSR